MSGVVLAQGPWETGPGTGGHRRSRHGREDMVLRLLENEKLLEGLGLTEEQVTALKEGSAELRKELVQLKADLGLAAMEQAEHLTEKTVDEAALMSAVEKAGAIRTEIAKKQMKQMLLIKRTLNEDQLQGLTDFRRRHLMRRRQSKELMRERGDRDPEAGKHPRRRWQERRERMDREGRWPPRRPDDAPPPPQEDEEDYE
jgi:hypothetical protein